MTLQIEILSTEFSDFLKQIISLKSSNLVFIVYRERARRGLKDVWRLYREGQTHWTQNVPFTWIQP